MTTREVILNKLAKLLRLKEDAVKGGHTNEGNSGGVRKNEAALIDQKIKRLSSKYHITEEEIRKAKDTEIIGNFFTTSKIRTQVEHLSWQQMLAKGIANRHACQLLMTHDRKSVRFVGRRREISICAAQFSLLNEAAVISFEKAKPEIEPIAPKHLKRDFFQGFVATILMRLKEAENNEQALMRIGKDLVKYMEENFEQDPGTEIAVEITNYLALLAGSRAAQKQNLDINLLHEGD